MNPRTTTQLRIVVAGAVLATCCLAQGKGKGGGNGGGTNGTSLIDQPIYVEVTATDPAQLPLQPHQAHRAGSIRHDGNPVYRDGESRVNASAGDRRNLGITFGRNAQRGFLLDLGDELPALAGDGNGRVATSGPPLGFFAASGVPRPDWGEDGVAGTADDGLVSGEFRIAVPHNVSALGAVPMLDSYTPIYCITDLDDPFPVIYELETYEVDANDPTTFSQMSATLRWQFEVAGHKWALYAGRNTRERDPNSGYTHDDCGPIVIQRVFATSNPDPYAPNPPFEIRVLPWQTTDPLHPRVGLGVGYLYYDGTKNNDPRVYVGAFDLRWADDAGTRWYANPL